MSFLSDLFKGNFNQLGGDITSQAKQIGGKNTLTDLGIGGATAAAIALPFLAPEIGAAFGIGDAAATGIADASATGAGLAGAGGGVGADLGAAGLAGLDLGSLAAIPGADTSASLTGFDALSAGLTPDTGTALGATTAATPSATGAASFAPDASFVDPNAFNAIDAAAGPAQGAPGATADAFGTHGGSAGGVGPMGGTGGGAAAPTGAQGGFWNNLTNSLTPSAIGSTLGKNALGLGIAGAGLGYDVLKGQQQTANEKALTSIAQQQQAEGATLQNYLNTGTLPPGLMDAVKTATAQSIATAKANMAAQGLSTDPNQNTALAAEINAINNQTPQLIAQIGEGLLGAGQQASGLSSQVYTTLANIDQTQTAAIGKAIASMSAALSGKTNVSLGGATLSVPTA